MAKCEIDPDCALENEHEHPCADARHEYTPRARERILGQMNFAIDQFYAFAQIINVHTFLEFAGLMHAYVKQCRELQDRGVDFITNPLELPDHAAGYLGEKLHCIYGDSLRKPENLARFLRELGVEMHPTPTEGVQP